MARFPVLGSVVLAVLTAACSTHRPAAGVAAEPMTLDQLADRTGCALQTQQGAAELVQGSCATDRGKYVLVTFTSDEAARSWLTEARPWGGMYLQGPRWVIVGTGAQLQQFQKEVGGTIVAGENHGGDGSAEKGHGH